MLCDQYFIAIVPPEPLATELYQLKKEFSAIYQTNAALRSPAHITLHMPFKYRSDKEEKIKNFLSDFSNEFVPFNIELNGYGFFEPRVIYLKVLENKQLYELQKTLSERIRTTLQLFNANYKTQGFVPHLTLAFRDLKKIFFYQAYSQLKEKSYYKKFVCNNISLLRHDGKQWQIIYNSYFT